MRLLFSVSTCAFFSERFFRSISFCGSLCLPHQRTRFASSLFFSDSGLIYMSVIFDIREEGISDTRICGMERTLCLCAEAFNWEIFRLHRKSFQKKRSIEGAECFPVVLAASVIPISTTPPPFLSSQPPSWYP